MDRIFQIAPSHFQPSIRPGMKREVGKTGNGIGGAQRLYVECREKMPDAAFKELAIECVDDIEGRGGQILFSQSAHHSVHKIQPVEKGLDQDTLIAAVRADVVSIGEDAADTV